MARLILEQPCETCGSLAGPWPQPHDIAKCRGSGGSRTVINLDALPSHRVEAAARALWDEPINDWQRDGVKAAIRAFLEIENKEDSEWVNVEEDRTQ